MANDIKFIDSFQEAWKAPSVNFAKGLSDLSLAQTMEQALIEGNQAAADQVRAILAEYGIKSVVVYDSATSDFVHVKVISSNRVTDGKKEYQVKNVNGNLTLIEIEKKSTAKNEKAKSSVMSDESDADDYAQRYHSVDAVRYKDDGSNVAFLRIIKSVATNGKRTVVFPNFEEAKAPGLTKNKFKQFIVMQSSLSHQERLQIVETNKDFQVLFFGKKPEVLQITGVLKNTVDNPWSVNMIFLWDEYMRGTKLAENGNICQLFIDGELFEGYPFNFNRSKIAGSDHIVNFNFSFLIKERIVVDGSYKEVQEQTQVS